MSGGEVLILVISDNVITNVPMKSSLSSGKSKDSSKHAASFQNRPESSG